LICNKFSYLLIIFNVLLMQLINRTCLVLRLRIIIKCTVLPVHSLFNLRYVCVHCQMTFKSYILYIYIADLDQPLKIMYGYVQDIAGNWVITSIKYACFIVRDKRIRDNEDLHSPPPPFVNNNNLCLLGFKI